MTNGLKIIGATLLSQNEVGEIPLELRRYNDWWWLRSSGFDGHSAACVRNDGSISMCGTSVSVCNTVRPVLQIKNLNSSNLQVGDIFKFGGNWFNIVTDELAFCISNIGTCEFRKDGKAKDADKYEKSDVKKFVDEWFVDSMAPYEETPAPAQLSTEEQVKSMGSTYESIIFSKNDYGNEAQMWDDIRDMIRILSKQDYQFKFYCADTFRGRYVLQLKLKCRDENMCGVTLDMVGEDTE